jgi:hypothetical protein
MTIVLIVEKNGSLKELNIKNYNEEELYKKAGFKNADGFQVATTWNIVVKEKSYIISVYGKTSGRAGQENKYEFPPPIDNTLFFGNCILTNKNENNEIVNLTKVEWNSIYEELYGGFEDIGSEDSEEESEEENELPITKDGYVKDGFVVDDSDESEYTDEDDEDKEEVIIPKKKLNKNITKPKTLEKPKKKLTVFDKIEKPNEESESQQNTFLDCSKELEEEEYV